MKTHKYKIGDVVYFLESSGVGKNRVTGIHLMREDYYYSFSKDISEYGWRHEDKLFATKEDLLKSL